MKLKLTVGITLLLCAPAVAQDVYPGCEVPTTVAGHHTFFVDPVKGSDKGDGSAARPWKSLNTVLAPASKLLATNSHKTLSGSPLLAVNPSAPIKAGDVIMLMSGDYGDVTLTNVFNSKFITIMSAPGQTPIIQHLKVGGGSRWIFQGLTFQSAYPSGAKQNANTQVLVNDGWGDKTSNIIFNQDVFQTASDSSGWSDADWYSKPNYFTIGITSACVSVTNSTLQNLLNGISINGSQTLIKNNTIQKFSNDAIDVMASKVAIVSNTITNPMHNGTSGLHPDAVQVWSNPINGKMTNPNTDILIDSNKIFADKSPDGVRGILQGITVGFCKNVTIQNNVISTNLWNAIFANGVWDTKILNNTVASSDPIGHPSRIYVGPSTYNHSSNVIVRNNLAALISADDTSVTMDHNAATMNFTTVAGGKTVWHPTGVSASDNFVKSALTSDFRNWNPGKSNFDLRLKSASSLNNMGSSTLAPLSMQMVRRGRPRLLSARTRDRRPDQKAPPPLGVAFLCRRC